jgi:hypothetical protein
VAKRLSNQIIKDIKVRLLYTWYTCLGSWQYLYNHFHSGRHWKRFSF